MAEQANQKNGQQPEQDLNQLLKVRREKLAELQANGKDPFVITKFDQKHHIGEIRENYADFEGKQVSVAGRLMAKRKMGSVSFGNVADVSGNMQIFVKRDTLGEDAYNLFKKYDIGDIVGDDIKADPDVDYSQREEFDDAGFSASQLDLFS